jgi:hypothetical protein
VAVAVLRMFTTRPVCLLCTRCRQHTRLRLDTC